MAGLAEVEANLDDDSGDCWEMEEVAIAGAALGFMAETESLRVEDDDAILGDDLLGVLWVVLGRLTGLLLLLLVGVLWDVALGRVTDLLPSCSCLTRETDFGVFN